MVTVPLASTTVSVTLSLALDHVTVLPSSKKLPVVGFTQPGIAVPSAAAHLFVNRLLLNCVASWAYI